MHVRLEAYYHATPMSPCTHKKITRESSHRVRTPQVVRAPNSQVRFRCMCSRWLQRSHQNWALRPHFVLPHATKPNTFTDEHGRTRTNIHAHCLPLARFLLYTAGAHAYQSYLRDNGLRLGQLFERMVAWARDASEEDLMQRPGRGNCSTGNCS